MANAVRYREELQYSGAKTPDQKDRAFKGLLRSFTKGVNKLGILAECRDRQFFESKGEKRRKKKKAAALQQKKDLNNRWRDHFGS